MHITSVRVVVSIVRSLVACVIRRTSASVMMEWGGYCTDDRCASGASDRRYRYQYCSGGQCLWSSYSCNIEQCGAECTGGSESCSDRCSGGDLYYRSRTCSAGCVWGSCQLGSRKQECSGFYCSGDTLREYTGCSGSSCNSASRGNCPLGCTGSHPNARCVTCHEHHCRDYPRCTDDGDCYRACMCEGGDHDGCTEICCTSGC